MMVSVVSRVRGSETYRESVAANVVGTDGQVRDLKVLDAMDVESLVQDTMLDDLVALPRCHAACAK